MDTETNIAARTHGRTDSITEHVTDDDDEELDPRIQRELDLLNVASADINQLENELDEARSKYRSIVSETSQRMEVIAHDQKRCIQKSREFYKLLNEAKMAQGEALKAARQFQTATGVYTAAKETEILAERSLQEKADSTTAQQLTSAWQDMLNHAISKVAEAEKSKTACEIEHKKRAAKFAEIETRKQMLEKKFSRSIKKAKPYFELKAELDIKLMWRNKLNALKDASIRERVKHKMFDQQKQNVNDLQAAIKANKVKYKAALRRLEKISEEIHQLRSEKLWSQVPRMPGVGAETDSIASGLSELALDSYDIKDEVDSYSVDGASLSDCPCPEGISVTVGADEPLDGDSVKSEPAGENASESKSELKDTRTENQDSEDEVFEDAEAGPENDADDTVEHNTTLISSEDSSLLNANKDTDEYSKEQGSAVDSTTQAANNEYKACKDTVHLETESKAKLLNESGSEVNATGNEKTIEENTEINMSNVERPSLSGEEE